MRPFFPFISGGSKGYYQNLLVLVYPVWIFVLLFEFIIICLSCLLNWFVIDDWMSGCWNDVVYEKLRNVQKKMKNVQVTEGQFERNGYDGYNVKSKVTICH